MSSSANGGIIDSTEVKTRKEGERIIAPTRRPDGTLRKEIRIRAGHVPQDEVPIYKPRGAILKKEIEQEGPPGSYPVSEGKSKSKSAKRNERKKEKRQQANEAALDKGNISDQSDALPADDSNSVPENEATVASKMNELSLSGNDSFITPSSNSSDCPTLEDQIQDVDKKIRALKKKIRLTEAQQQKTSDKDMTPEQLEKVAKLEGWHGELKLMEEKKAGLMASVSINKDS